jgi:hypothetical protein
VRRLATADRILAFLRALGRSARQPARLYLTGGATAVLEGWRDSTVDVDVLLVPDEELLRAIPSLKEELEVNVETGMAGLDEVSAFPPPAAIHDFWTGVYAALDD